MADQGRRRRRARRRRRHVDGRRCASATPTASRRASRGTSRTSSRRSSARTCSRPPTCRRRTSTSSTATRTAARSRSTRTSSGAPRTARRGRTASGTSAPPPIPARVSAAAPARSSRSSCWSRRCASGCRAVPLVAHPANLVRRGSNRFEPRSRVPSGPRPVRTLTNRVRTRFVRSDRAQVEASRRDVRSAAAGRVGPARLGHPRTSFARAFARYGYHALSARRCRCRRARSRRRGSRARDARRAPASAASGSCAMQAASSRSSSSRWRSCRSPAGRESAGRNRSERSHAGRIRPTQPRRLRRLVEREVEVRVRAHRALARRRRRAARRARRGARAPPPPRRSVEPLGRAAHRQRLEREPHLEQIAQLVDVEIEHLRALVRHVLREPERLQLPHRLADRRDAHPERPRQLVQPQRRPGRQLAHDDRLAQLLQRVFGHRPVAHRRPCSPAAAASTDASHNP